MYRPRPGQAKICSMIYRLANSKPTCRSTMARTGGGCVSQGAVKKYARLADPLGTGGTGVIAPKYVNQGRMERAADGDGTGRASVSPGMSRCRTASPRTAGCPPTTASTV